MGKRMLTQGNVYITLLSFSLPFLAANLLQALYGAVDLFIVGRYADPAAVSAVATGSQVMQTVTSLCIGLTTGGTVMIGQLFGARRRRDVSDTIATSLCLFGLIAAVLTVVMASSVDMLCRAMRVPPEAWDGTKQYLFITSCGIAFIVGYNALAGILRGLGDSLTPLVFVAVACAVNVAGDLLLVGVYRMGAAGAAIATAASQGVALLFIALFLLARGWVGRFLQDRFRIRIYSAKQVLFLGMPIAMQEGLVNLSFLLITAIVNGMGLTASAAVGVVEKVIMFSMLPVTAFASAVSAMTAQHAGAGLEKRGRACLKGGVALSLVFGVAFFLFAQARGGFLVRLFCPDPQVVAAGAAYLRSYSLDSVIVCFVFCMNAYFSGCGHTVFPLAHSVLATFLVRVPLSALFSRLPAASMLAIGCAAPLASLFSLILCEWFLRRMSAVHIKKFAKLNLSG